jgi:signal peptidase I
MRAPSVLGRIFFAWFGYSSVHWAAGRWRRALFWDLAILVALLGVFRITFVPAVVIGVAQLVDAALIRPVRDRSNGGYAVASLIAACIYVLLAVTLRTSWVEAFKIPSGAMIPTLAIGDHIFVDKTARTPERGDVIVFKYPKEPEKDFIKRTVAVGGDTVEMDGNQLVINGKPVPRTHVDEPCSYDEYLEEADRWETRECEAWNETLDGHSYRVVFDRHGSARSFPVVTVPAGQYFVLGDNRDNSHDSRYWGSVPPDHVKGTARTVWWSSGQNGVRWERFNRRIR